MTEVDQDSCSIWLRASTAHQDTGAQYDALIQEAARRGLTVVRVFDVTGSGFHDQQEHELSKLVDGLQRREYSKVLCWAIDRLTQVQSASCTVFDRSKRTVQREDRCLPVRWRIGYLGFFRAGNGEESQTGNQQQRSGKTNSRAGHNARLGTVLPRACIHDRSAYHH